jgi:membrane protein required for colicin V production
MAIDVLYVLVLLYAVLKGMKKGLIVALCSALGLIIGLAAALKFSATVATYLKKDFSINDYWLPVLSFVLVFAAAAIAVRIIAGIIEKAVEAVWLGWANKAGGALLYAALYTTIYSILLFYALQMQFISRDTASRSHTYAFIQPWGLYVMERIGNWFHAFKDVFAQLQDFFARKA